MLFKKKETQEEVQTPEVNSVYNDYWMNKQVINHNLVPSDDKGKVAKILVALEKKNGQCPCGGNGVQYKCPCVKIREQGICTCGLFKSLPPRQIKAESTVKSIQRNS